MKRIILILIMIILITPQVAHAKDSGWEFRFFGINYKDFENRDWKPMIVGAVASLAAHELGHIVTGRLVGMDTTFKFNDMMAWADDYDNKSNDQKALYHAGGFISQVVIGSVLTAIPTTRHSDFAVGFNGFSSITGFSYAVTGGTRKDSSDVANLDNDGYNGTATALTSGFITGGLTYINLNKVKEDINDSPDVSYLQTTKYD